MQSLCDWLIFRMRPPHSVLVTHGETSESLTMSPGRHTKRGQSLVKFFKSNIHLRDELWGMLMESESA